MESVSGTCPFLVAVVADRLWMYPVPAYCRRPGGPVRVPAPGTLSGVCTTAAHARCPGFQASGGASDRVLDRQADDRRRLRA
jgi:hypothetical protein